MILNDWLRGKIPYFTPPPKNEDDSESKDSEVVKEEEKVAEKACHNDEVSYTYLEYRIKVDNILNFKLTIVIQEKKNEVKGVEQIFRNIQVTTSFLPDDLGNEETKVISHYEENDIIEENIQG